MSFLEEVTHVRTTLVFSSKRTVGWGSVIRERDKGERKEERETQRESGPILHLSVVFGLIKKKVLKQITLNIEFPNFYTHQLRCV